MTQLKMTFGKKGLGAVEDEFDSYNYGRLSQSVFALYDKAMKDKHNYIKAESDDFTDMDRIRESRELMPIFAQLIAYANQINKKANKPAITPYTRGYSEGRHAKRGREMDIKDIADLVRKELKIEFPDFKFKVRIERYAGGQSLNVSIDDMPYNPFSDFYQERYKKGITGNDIGQEIWKDYNRPGEIKKYSEKAEKDLDKIKKITNQYNFNDSDSQIDYFHVNYYEHVGIDDSTLMAKFYPNHPDVLDRQARNKAYEEKRKKQSEAAKNRLTDRIPKFAIAWFTGTLHRSWEKYKLPNGYYMVRIVKSPNGRSRYMLDRYDFQVMQRTEESDGPKILEHLEDSKYGAKAKTDHHYYFNHNGVWYKPIYTSLSSDRKSLLEYTPGAESHVNPYTQERLRLKAIALEQEFDF